MAFIDIVNTGQKFPIPKYNFRVDFLFAMVTPQDTRFSSVEGLGWELQFDDTPCNNNNGSFVTNVNWTPVTLTRGLTSNISALTIWYEAVLFTRKVVKMPVLITLLDDHQNPMYGWLLHNAYPISLQVGDFNSMESAVAIETFTLKYDMFMRFNAANPVSKLAMKGILGGMDMVSDTLGSVL